MRTKLRAGYRDNFAPPLLGQSTPDRQPVYNLLHRLRADIAAGRFDLDDVQRVTAALSAEAHDCCLGERGFVVTSWPRALQRKAARIIGYNGIEDAPQLFDHQYALRHRPCGRYVLRGEPYSLGAYHLRVLSALEAAGWRVSIDAWRGLHFPGSTTVIEVVPPGSHGSGVSDCDCGPSIEPKGKPVDDGFEIVEVHGRAVA
jgi:hypothetical protein